MNALVGLVSNLPKRSLIYAFTASIFQKIKNNIILNSRLGSASFCFSNMQNNKDAKNALICFSAISSAIISSPTGIMSAWHFIPVSCLFHQGVSSTPLPIIQLPWLDGINHPTSVYQDQGLLASVHGLFFWTYTNIKTHS